MHNNKNNLEVVLRKPSTSVICQQVLTRFQRWVKQAAASQVSRKKVSRLDLPQHRLGHVIVCYACQPVKDLQSRSRDSATSEISHIKVKCPAL